MPPTLSPQLERKKVFMAFGLAPFAQSPDLMEGSSNYLLDFLFCVLQSLHNLCSSLLLGETPLVFLMSMESERSCIRCMILVYVS